MELLISGVKDDYRKDFENFLDGLSDKISNEMKEKIKKSRTMKFAMFGAKLAHVNMDAIFDSHCEWKLEDGVYRVMMLIPLESVPSAKTMIKIGIEKELKKADLDIKVEMGS